MGNLKMQSSEIEALAKETLDIAVELHSVCDGARTKDYSGFAASDVNIGWALAAKTADELSAKPALLVGLIQLLRKYGDTQIGDRFRDVYRRGEELRSDCLDAAKKRQTPAKSSSSCIMEAFDEEIEDEIKRIRKFGGVVRKDMKKKRDDLSFAASTRSVDYDEESIIIHWDRKDFQYRELYDVVKALPFRSWKSELTSWAIPFAGNERADIDELLGLILHPIDRAIPEKLTERMDKGTWKKEVGDLFGLDVAYGKGSHAGRMELIVKFPAPWDGAWKMIGLDGGKFKDKLKTEHLFQFKGDEKAWAGTLTLVVFEWLSGVAEEFGFEWTLTEQAETALRGLRFLSQYGNFIPQKSTNPCLASWRSANGWALREYQKAGIKFIRSKRASMILDDMGSGKTC